MDAFRNPNGTYNGIKALAAWSGLSEEEVRWTAERMQALIKAGATSASAYITHGVLSGGAVARVTSSPLESLIITDSIAPTEAVKLAHNIRPLTIAPLMAESIQRISEERSVSSLFD